MSRYQPAVSSSFRAGPQAEMRRGDISHCQPHSNYASLHLIPFTLHLSLSFQCPILRTFSTTGPFHFLLSISFQFTIPPSRLSFHSLSTLLFLFSFQSYVSSQPQVHSLSSFPFLFSFQFYFLNHPSVHSPPFYFFSVSNSTFSIIPLVTLHLSLSFQCPILRTFSTLGPFPFLLSLPLYSFQFSLGVRSCQSPPFLSSIFFHLHFLSLSASAPFSLLSLPFKTFLERLYTAPKEPVFIYCIYNRSVAVADEDLLIQEVQNTRWTEVIKNNWEIRRKDLPNAPHLCTERTYEGVVKNAIKKQQ